MEADSWVLKATSPEKSKRVKRQRHEACGRGHIYSDIARPENPEGTWRWTTDSRGYQQRHCILCERERNAKRGPKTDEQREADRLRKRKKRAILAGDENAGEYVKSTAPKKINLDYLRMNGKIAEAESALGFAIERTGPTPCKGEYDSYIEYDERVPPSNATAKEMCEDCAVQHECLIFALLLKPKVGVFGGSVFIDGKVQK